MIRHARRSLLFCALLMLLPGIGARAQDTLPRRLQLQGRYLNLPVKTGAAKKPVRIEIEGRKVHELEIELAEAEPDFWVFVDVAVWRGKDATIHAPAAVLPVIECSDEIKGREPLYAESKRPQFHFTSRRGRLNDPNGLVFFQGEYHLFYQLHPYGWNSGSKSWGHAVSRDLVHWEELPIALHADESGMMFSGSGVVDWRNTTGFQTGSEPPLVLIYTATGPPRSQCLAYSNDRGRTWTKFAGNPVLPEVAHNNRDPKVFWHEPTQRWVMILHCTPRGKKLPVDPKNPKKKTGELGIFTSPDLKRWTDESRIVGFFECPDLFPMKVEGTGETRWIVHGGSGEYLVGDFDGRKFTPRSGPLHGPYGDAFYAGQNFSDMKDGRVVQLGWAKMGNAAFEGMPFNQMMNFPCELTLKPTKNGPKLAWQPVHEIEALRVKRNTLVPGPLAAGQSPLTLVRTEFFDLRADIEVGSAGEIVWNIHGTEVVLKVAKNALAIGKNSMPVPIKDGRASLRMLCDRGLLEVFAEGGLKFGAFTLPPSKLGAPLATELTARGGAAKIVSLEVDELASIWPSVAPKQASKENVIVYKEPGRYGGWPANHGLWQWGDELVVGFQVCWYKHATNDHAIDRSKPSFHWQSRSLDGGLTWKVEDRLPFSDPKAEKKPVPLTESLDFTAPDFALMFCFGSLHVGPSWFYVTNDRCKTWRGPFSFAVDGIDKICTRTDLVVLGKRDCLMFGSAAKSDGKEGRVFCARTTDGGLHWKLVSLIGPEPAEGDFAIMPSTVRLPSGALITTIRHGKGSFKISAWRSDDLGRHWKSLGEATPNIGSNPPALVILKDGRLCLTYGFRRKPYGIRARISHDEGRTWGPEIILRDDGLTGDLGYPRSVVRPDGKVLTVYYFNGPRDEDRTIQATLWTPPATVVNSLGMKLVRIEPGSFVMGQDGPAADHRMTKHPAQFDDADWDEKPAHKVTITRAFHMGTTEVTVGQYRQFKACTGADDEAVTGVSWHDAIAFCEWLSKKEDRTYRLPTEAEWEYACRAGTTTLFHTGDALPTGFHKWFRDTGLRDRFFTDGKLPSEYRTGKTNLSVAQTPANAWGLFDMHGNVAEWCHDWYGPYVTGDQTDPLGYSDGDFRVFRGGSHSVFTRLLRSANRSGWLPGGVSDKIGFRVVLGELPPGKTLPPLPAPQVDQSLARIGMTSADVPFFAGPKPFVKVPPNSFGPMFSTHNHSPAITECPNGDLFAVWYSCVEEPGSELCNLASRLRSGASDWEPATPFWDGPDVNDHAPKLWWDSDKTLYHFARGFAENIVRTSTNNGATWSKARIVQPHGEFGNQLLRLKDGTLVISHDSRQVSLVFSKDSGQTWSFNDVAKRASDFRPGGRGFRYPGIHAPLVQLADGRIMAISRNDKEEDQAKFAGKTPFSYTSDLGKTWTYELSEFPAISSVQRQVLMRLREGPLLLCSFTDQWRDWKKRKGMTFKKSDGTEFTGYGLFAALSFDDGKTWPVRKLVTPGGAARTVNGIDRGEFTLSDTMAEPCGYLAAVQTRDGSIQLITSKNHYAFNLAWLKKLPGHD